MLSVDQQHIRDTIVEALRVKFEAAQIDGDSLSDDFALVQNGLLDSFEFVELASVLQNKFDVDLDFGDTAPEEFTTLGGLARVVDRSVRGNGNG